MKLYLAIIVSFLCFINGHYSLAAENSQHEDVCSESDHQNHDHCNKEQIQNPVQLIQQYLNQGKLKEAKTLLDNLDGDQAVLESFRGILAMKQNSPEQAVEHFKKVLLLKPTQTTVWLYLGQAYFQMKQYRAALDALLKGESLGKTLPSYFKLKARTEHKLGKIDAAYTTLENAVHLFPDYTDLLLEQALLLVHAHLYTAGLNKGQQYLLKNPHDRAGYLIIGEALRSAGRAYEAIIILENAALQFDQDADVLARLAFAYATDFKNLIAARIFERATLLGGKYAFWAAEQYSLAGHMKEAIQCNAMVGDTRKRLTQRLAFYLEQEWFDRAVSLEAFMKQERILDDTNRYRLAYAHMRLKNYKSAAMYCKQIQDPGLIESAHQLLATITGFLQLD